MINKKVERRYFSFVPPMLMSTVVVGRLWWWVDPACCRIRM